MVILYVTRQDGATVNVSHNLAWMVLRAFAEIGLGLIVICTLSLPNFIEVKGKKLRIFLSYSSVAGPSR